MFWRLESRFAQRLFCVVRRCSVVSLPRDLTWKSVPLPHSFFRHAAACLFSVHSQPCGSRSRWVIAEHGAHCMRIPTFGRERSVFFVLRSFRSSTELRAIKVYATVDEAEVEDDGRRRGGLESL